MTETPQPHVITAERIRCFLANLPLFGGLPSEALAQLCAQAERVHVSGGTALFDQGDPSDALYVLFYGRLAAWRRGGDGEVRRLGHIAPGGYVGETGLLLEQARTATVMALRDSELLRWSKATFEQVMSQYPAAMLRLAREALSRYAESVNRPAQARCFAVLPGGIGIDVGGFASRLAAALGGPDEVRVIYAGQARNRGSAWYALQEQQVAGVIYVGDLDSAWRERCARQSDVVLMLVDASSDPAKAIPPPSTISEHTPKHLVLMQHEAPPYRGTRTWLEAYPPVIAHHHVHSDADLARVARLLAGKAIGLVLSGGGARGFAHVGVLRVLHGLGLDIDYVAGCSAGAIVAAGHAAGWDDAQQVRALRAAFVDDNPLSDLTLPLVAIHRGRKASLLLQRAYGDADIEDLPLPFFAVSSDLTSGTLHVHERGPLWMALRASTAIPGVVPPLFHDHRVLVDGGVIDNLPVSTLRQRIAGHIIAVDVGGNYRIDTALEEAWLPPFWQQIRKQWGKKTYPGIAQLLWRAVMVNSDASSARQRRQSSVLLKPDLSGIDLFDWKAFDRIVAIGETHANHRITALKALLDADPPLRRAETDADLAAQPG